ncbi:MAG: host attachment protein [Rubrivivax sp.]|jgi:protein required for attachment to host cells|nr:host attachment protein [Betaproteobacteria bacterium]MBP6463312.1 host attachment protein [Rubrivivax sp.]MBK7276855.1 host attachment protein [Betaproteobacteria bacterium]MBK7459756.1 host attachment protein [Betaproteobacteria bacterium]MBK7515612.1 host attachment protein [Betaproteobacteria bacterium]
MMTIQSIRSVQPLEAVLVANASRARLFDRDAENGAMRETASFVHPQSRMKGRELGRDRPGQAFKGESRTAYEAPTGPHEKEAAAFARELAQRLGVMAQTRRYSRLVLLASTPFLGELKKELDSHTSRLLQATVAVDLTTFDGAELEHRVAEALQETGVAMPMAAD